MAPLVALLVAALITSCDLPWSAGGPGPLRSPLGGGGNSLDVPPGANHWHGTFGSLLLCTDGDPVLIDEVEYQTEVRPAALKAFVRYVAPDELERPVQRSPMLALVGPVKQLLRSDLEADRLSDAEGATVDTRCVRDSQAAFTEVLTEMEVDSTGGWVTGIVIHYTSDGEEYELEVDWNYAACGSGIRDAFVCPQR